MMFNEDYSAISVESFQNLITYYAKRPNKVLRMEATNTAEFYYDTYKDIIIQLLETMKNCLISRDYDGWVTTVTSYYEQFINQDN